ncbi:MAG: adenosylcobinamide-GDP ribazoletransferase [Sporomusaceae bacterium]|nr:adenosylcobinamide-GDP ribazoletransferase [Sporomusaceae bacterium]
MRLLLDDFIRALQFLTRLPALPQVEWSQAAFGRSARLFPLVGGLIGLLLAALDQLLQLPAAAPEHAAAALLVTAGILVTGGLHCDGFMDTLDGVFSGRPRQQMLEIMKDSRVGAFGVIGFCLLLLTRYSLLLDMPPSLLPAALLTAPVVGRMAAVAAIYGFPYARREGLGKSFHDSACGGNLAVAAALTTLLLACIGTGAVLTGAAVLLVSWGVAGWFNRKLDGLTGDVYGAIIEIAEVLTLLAFVLAGPALVA